MKPAHTQGQQEEIRSCNKGYTSQIWQYTQAEALESGIAFALLLFV